MVERSPYKRLFTVEEVNELIPKLELIMQRVQLLGFELRRGLRAAVDALGGAPDPGTVSALARERPELRGLVDEMEKLVTEIEASGGEFKGLDLGLIDYPAEIDGEIVFLCWQYGEKEITHWHSLDGGFEGRRPLPATAQRSLLQ
jgi:hypothetical protein